MSDEFIVLQWPEAQIITDFPNFEKNTQKIDNPNLIIEFGEAYLVRVSWLVENLKTQS